MTICGTHVTLLYSPKVYNNNHIYQALAPGETKMFSKYIVKMELRIESTHRVKFISCRQNFVNRWVWGGLDRGYISNVDINWGDILQITAKLTGKKEFQGVGLLNFNNTELDHWEQLIPNVTHVVLELEYAAKNMTWESQYPEWIDEEEETEVPVCPSLPSLRSTGIRLNLIAVKLPHANGGNWSRDVARLHLQLAVARLTTSFKGNYPLYVLFVTNFFPIPNLFTCKELVGHVKGMFLGEKLHLPLGSCELAFPLRGKELSYVGNVRREAYATILHSAHVYVCGAIAAEQSIHMSGSTRDLVILVDETIRQFKGSEKDAYNEWNYNKFRLWQLTDYDKIIFIDADLLILRNIDFLFGMPEITATRNNGTLFNSGVMVVELSNCTFKLLMDHINEFESYNGGDQGYLNEIFTWWHRIPRHMNFLKHFWVGDEEEKKQMKTLLFGADPPILYVLHYLGMKPWLCFRDYDCNWNCDVFHEFPSDVAHERWWKVHDVMPELLQQFCMLKSKQKAQLEWDRRQAEVANYTSGHWQIKVKDTRLKKCIDNLCSWENMLKHWGETNWTDDESHTPTPPAIATSSLSDLRLVNLAFYHPCKC
uniref:Hexosyltransferase n=1 Tax=Glycine max TaxID=3847 RepID=A0A0R0JRA3_SOYBN